MVEDVGKLYFVECQRVHINHQKTREGGTAAVRILQTFINHECSIREDR